MAAWVADCAERVLPLFERAYPEDDRPRNAIETCRAWVRTGVFRMAEIRGGASLGLMPPPATQKRGGARLSMPHGPPARRWRPHMSPQHAYGGGAYYALKAVAAADPANAVANVAAEREWQAERLPKGGLREEIMERIVVEERGGGGGVLVKLRKGEGGF